jgi:hypothetical protein
VPSFSFLRNVSFLHHVQNVSGAHPPIVDSLLGTELPERKVDYSRPINAEVKKGWSLNSISIRPYGVVLKNMENYLSTYSSTDLLSDFGCFFSFLILYKADRTPWTGDQPVVRSLPNHRTTQTQNKRTQTTMA